MKVGTLIKEETAGEWVMPTLEAIAFQKDDPFGPELEVLVSEYMTMVADQVPERMIEADKSLKDRFSKLCRDRLGLNVYLITNSYEAATMPNVYVEHSAMVRDAIHKEFKKDPAAAGQVLLRALPANKSLGTVNTQTAKITGWLSQQPVPLFLNFTKLLKTAKFSAAELTAIILHELGHIFDGAAMASRVNNTNQVVSDVARHIVDKDRGGSVEFVYKELKSLDPLLEKETVEGLMSGEATVMGVSAFRLIQGCIRSLSGSSAYNRTSFEAMADSFAVRFGYGVPLSTGLEKILSSPGRITLEIFAQVATVYIMYSLMMAMIALVKAMFVATKAAVFLNYLIALFIRVAGFVTLLTLNRMTSYDYTYDDTTDRFDRIRKNVIEALKDPAVGKKEKIAVLEQLKVIQDVTDNAIDVPRVIQKLTSLIFLDDRRSTASVLAQKQMEAIIANDIFIAASKLATKS